MSDPAYWLIFFSAALALNLSPGPDLFFVLSRTLAGGRRVGLASACGVCSGALVHVAAAALGISAILATSALAFAVVKYVGGSLSALPGHPDVALGGVRLLAEFQGRPEDQRLACLSARRSHRYSQSQGSDFLHGVLAAIRTPRSGLGCGAAVAAGCAGGVGRDRRGERCSIAGSPGERDVAQ